MDNTDNTNPQLPPKPSHPTQKDGLEKSKSNGLGAKWQIVNKDDVESRLLVCKTLFTKTADPNAMNPDDVYYTSVVDAILEQARLLNFLPGHLKTACQRFLFAKQYGSRIELADFFDGEEHKPLLSEWEIQQIKKQEQRRLEGGNNGS